MLAAVYVSNMRLFFGLAIACGVDQSTRHNTQISPYTVYKIMRGTRARMDRRELRFRVLFEYYNHLHSDADYDPYVKISAIDADNNEKRAAGIWLIDEELVEGQVIDHGRISDPSIGRINSKGINYVESVMYDAFTEIRGKDEGFDMLTKPDKIKRFVAECLNNPATGSLCNATFDAIASLMG